MTNSQKFFSTHSNEFKQIRGNNSNFEEIPQTSNMNLIDFGSDISPLYNSKQLKKNKLNPQQPTF
jgi:hypothetical protein